MTRRSQGADTWATARVDALLAVAMAFGFAAFAAAYALTMIVTGG